MKKFLKILLIVVAVLAAAVLVIRLLTPETEYFLTEEECAQRVVGTWEDPLGDYAPYVFNEDGTGMLEDIPVTWKIDGRHNKGDGGSPENTFRIHCETEANDNTYTVTFYYYEEIDFCEATPYLVTDSSGTTTLLGSSFDEETGRLLIDVKRYQAGSWEIVELNTGNWEEYFRIDHMPRSRKLPSGEVVWDYMNYVMLNPEYAVRAMSLGSADYALGCTYSYLAMPYAIHVDEKTGAVSVGERNDNGQEAVDLYTFPNDRTYIPNLPGRLYIEDITFGAELDYIFVYGGPDAIKEGEEAYIIERSRLLDGSGTLLLAKDPADR